MRSVCTLMLLFAAVLVPASAPSQETPSAVAVDGDTLEIDARTVRLYGIDAPELGQLCGRRAPRDRCGRNAALTLRRLIGDGPVTCRKTPVDDSDEGEICSVGLVDLSEAMLRQGYAVAKPSALTVYKRAEAEAKTGRLGIWRGEFVPPEEWRAGRRLDVDEGVAAEECVVKGIIGEAGEHVYVVQSDPAYESVTIDPGSGERLFCSDDAAELAGWRRWPKAVIRKRTGAELN